MKNRKTVTLLGALVIALLTGFFFFVRMKYKRKIEADRHYRQVSDSLVKADEQQRSAFDSLLKFDKHFADSIYREYEIRQARLSKEFPRAIFSDSKYSADGKGNAWEEKEVKGTWKFKMEYKSGSEYNKMHFDITNGQLMSTVNRTSDWFFHLEMDLAALKVRCDNSPADFEAILKAVIEAQKNYPDKFVSGNMQIEPIHFNKGYLALERIETNGRYTELQFTVFLKKENSALSTKQNI